MSRATTSTAMVLLAALATPVYGQMSVSETHQYASLQSESVASFVSSLEAKSTGCDDPMIGSIEQGIANLDARLADLDGMAFSTRSGAGTRHIALRQLRLSAPLIVDSWRNFATGLLKARCLDEADRVYRKMLTSYAGTTFASVRDEAKVGIDDVRSARMNAQSQQVQSQEPSMDNAGHK